MSLSSSTIDPSGSRVGSDAATPDWAATPAAVTSPLQYAVASKERRAPGAGGRASITAPGLQGASESSIVTSYDETKLTAATAVTSAFRRSDAAMITSSIVGVAGPTPELFRLSDLKFTIRSVIRLCYFTGSACNRWG